MKKNLSIFDLSDEEIQSKARIIALRAKKETWRRGLPISYRNEICTGENMIIHEYANGVKYLVCINPHNGISESGYYLGREIRKNKSIKP